jgi:hypothetical protein
MRTAATARPSRLQTGFVQLGASFRGIVYGFALIVAVPLAWTSGRPLPALLIGVVALVGISIEALIHSRMDWKPKSGAEGQS